MIGEARATGSIIAMIIENDGLAQTSVNQVHVAIRMACFTCKEHPWAGALYTGSHCGRTPTPAGAFAATMFAEPARARIVIPKSEFISDGSDDVSHERSKRRRLSLVDSFARFVAV